jgi:hypothetical protein
VFTKEAYCYASALKEYTDLANSTRDLVSDIAFVAFDENGELVGSSSLLNKEVRFMYILILNVNNRDLHFLHNDSWMNFSQLST